MKADSDQIGYQSEHLASKHDRTEFSCGIEVLDRYLRTQAVQDVEKRVAAAFVLTPDGKTVAGFYTLSAHTISLGDLPSSVTKKLPRYPDVPGTLLGRLAVSQRFQGRGIGELLLLDAFKRVLGASREIASAVIVVDAKNGAAREFYLHHQFIPLPLQPNRLFCPVAYIARLFGPSVQPDK